jgi:O-methyltransferase
MSTERIHLPSSQRPGLCDFVPEQGFLSNFVTLFHPGVRRLMTLLGENGIQTLLEQHRLLAIIELVQFAAKHAKGDVIELGVYKGGSAAAIAWALDSRGLQRALHLCDNFEGMPESKPWEWHRSGDFGDTAYERVVGRLGALLPDFPFRFYRGLFSQTLSALPQVKFCFAHVDADLYESVRESCEYVYPRMSRGGIIVFDDYGAPTCPGATRAVNEFFSDKLEKPSHIAVSSYGVRIGTAETDFQRLILSRTFGPAALNALWQGPRKAVRAAVLRTPSIRKIIHWIRNKPLESLPDAPDLFHVYRSLCAAPGLERKPGGWMYKGEFYPDYLTVGGAGHAIFDKALKFCSGNGVDIGAGLWPLPGAKPVDVWRGPGLGLSIGAVEDGTLDYVFSSHCLEHIEDWKEALQSWTAKLKLGGVLFLYLPHPKCAIWQRGSPFVGDGHKWTPTPGIIRQQLTGLGCSVVCSDDGPDPMFSFFVCAQKETVADPAIAEPQL